MKFTSVVLTLALSAAWALSSYAAPPEIKKDDQGLIVLQTDDLNHKTTHTYSIDGERIKTESDNGQRLFFDKSGQGNGTASTQKGDKQ